MKTTPKEKWNQLKREIIAKINEIDSETPFSEKEKAWWMEMTDILREVSNLDD